MRGRRTKGSSVDGRDAIVVFAALLALLAIGPVLAGAKNFKGNGGDDRITGTEEDDRILTRGGDDRAKGEGGDDTIAGGGGADRLHGGEGADKLSGGGRADKLVGDEGTDKLGGGGGRDKLKAADGAVDEKIDGGKGDDTCVAEFADSGAIRRCETVKLKDGGGGSDGGGGGDPGGSDGGGAPAALQIEKASTSCTPPQEQGAGCQFTVNGSGADTSSGSVEVTSGDQTTGGGPASAEDDGTFEGSGVFVCPGETTATLKVSFGEETDEVTVPCETAGEPPAPDEDLTLTASVTQCTATGGLGFDCTFTASGTGADLPTGSATVTQGDPGPVLGGGTVEGNAEDGTYDVTNGRYGCNAPVTLTVRIGDEVASVADLPCG